MYCIGRNVGADMVEDSLASTVYSLTRIATQLGSLARDTILSRLRQTFPNLLMTACVELVS